MPPLDGGAGLLLIRLGLVAGVGLAHLAAAQLIEHGMARGKGQEHGETTCEECIDHLPLQLRNDGVEPETVGSLDEKDVAGAEVFAQELQRPRLYRRSDERCADRRLQQRRRSGRQGGQP